MVVAHQCDYAAVLGGTGEIGVAEHVAGAIDTRALAVPHAEYAIELALAAQLGLLGAPQRGGGEFLVEAGLELDVGGGELAGGANELLVETSERRAAVAGDIAGGVQPGAAVALFLHQAGTDQRLIPGHEYVRLVEVVFVVEADRSKRHDWLSKAAPGPHSYRLALRDAKRRTFRKGYTAGALGQFRYWRAF